MAWYSRRRSQATRQVVADVFMAVWTVVWVLVARGVAGVISAIADPVRTAGDQARTSAVDLRDAADRVGGVPGVGDSLRGPFDEAANSLDRVAASATDQVAAIELAAGTVGVVTFAIPFLLMLLVWLPPRVRYLRASTAGQRLVDSTAGADLLALRALATQPLRRIDAVSPDAVDGWRRGDREVVDRLAELEVHRLGLRARTDPDPDQV